MTSKWKEVDPNSVELDGPFECPACGFHMMIDSTYIDQVDNYLICPSCENHSQVTL